MQPCVSRTRKKTTTHLKYICRYSNQFQTGAAGGEPLHQGPRDETVAFSIALDLSASNGCDAARRTCPIDRQRRAALSHNESSDAMRLWVFHEKCKIMVLPGDRISPTVRPSGVGVKRSHYLTFDCLYERLMITRARASRASGIAVKAIWELDPQMFELGNMRRSALSERYAPWSAWAVHTTEP